ncbi:MAG: MAPEG family protein, partial [Betaproteobacteria bacterium]
KGANTEAVDAWAWLFVATRLLYIYCYVSDRATLRSVVWMAGLAVTIRLYFWAF